MKPNKKYLLISIFSILGISLIFLLFIYLKSTAQKQDSKNIVTITPQSQRAAGIVVTTLQPQTLTVLVSAPGEVIPDANKTSKVTVRVAAQVIKRFAQEGQHVKENEILATLSSVDMSKVQGDLLLAMQEWERVKTLGKDAVSGKRYSAAQVASQQAYSTALAYGMTDAEIQELLRTQKPSQSKGEFNLLAPRSGTAFNINFTEGELVEPGRVLLQIVDESIVWIDAKLPPELARPVKVGDTTRILVSNRQLKGKVIQVHHQLDEVTRTRSVRLEVMNTEDILHPSQFVNCQIESSQTQPVLAMPIAAVLRTPDGDWAIYIEKKPGEFQQAEVKLIEVIDNQAVIEGIAPGTRVATQGAFFIHSELNKKGFGADAH